METLYNGDRTDFYNPENFGRNLKRVFKEVVSFGELLGNYLLCEEGVVLHMKSLNDWNSTPKPKLAGEGVSLQDCFKERIWVGIYGTQERIAKVKDNLKKSLELSVSSSH